MAKGKAKSETSAAKGAAKSSAAKPAAKKPAAAAAKKTATTAGGSSAASLIDTSLAAANAARMLSAGVNPRQAGQAPSGRKTESSLFKQLKSGLNKPSGTAMDNLLNKTHGPSNIKSGHGYGKQVGHNQTIGSDAARTGVPRRTNG